MLSRPHPLLWRHWLLMPFFSGGVWSLVGFSCSRIWTHGQLWLDLVGYKKIKRRKKEEIGMEMWWKQYTEVERWGWIYFIIKKFESIKNLKFILMKTTSEFLLCKSARIKIILMYFNNNSSWIFFERNLLEKKLNLKYASKAIKDGWDVGTVQLESLKMDSKSMFK